MDPEGSNSDITKSLFRGRSETCIHSFTATVFLMHVLERGILGLCVVSCGVEMQSAVPKGCLV